MFPPPLRCCGGLIFGVKQKDNLSLAKIAILIISNAPRDNVAGRASTGLEVPCDVSTSAELMNWAEDVLGSLECRVSLTFLLSSDLLRQGSNRRWCWRWGALVDRGSQHCRRRDRSIFGVQGVRLRVDYGWDCIRGLHFLGFGRCFFRRRLDWFELRPFLWRSTRCWGFWGDIEWVKLL